MVYEHVLGQQGLPGRLRGIASKKLEQTNPDSHLLSSWGGEPSPAALAVDPIETARVGSHLPAGLTVHSAETEAAFQSQSQLSHISPAPVPATEQQGLAPPLLATPPSSLTEVTSGTEAQPIPTFQPEQLLPQESVSQRESPPLSLQYPSELLPAAPPLPPPPAVLAALPAQEVQPYTIESTPEAVAASDAVMDEPLRSDPLSVVPPATAAATSNSIMVGDFIDHEPDDVHFDVVRMNPTSEFRMLSPLALPLVDEDDDRAQADCFRKRGLGQQSAAARTLPLRPLHATQQPRPQPPSAELFVDEHAPYHATSKTSIALGGRRVRHTPRRGYVGYSQKAGRAGSGRILGAASTVYGRVPWRG